MYYFRKGLILTLYSLLTTLLTPRLELTVVPATDTDPLTVLVSVAVPLSQTAGLVRSAAVLPAPAGPGQDLQVTGVQHHGLLSTVRPDGKLTQPNHFWTQESFSKVIRSHKMTENA